MSSTAGPQTLFDKLWAAHYVSELDDGRCLIHIDRHLVHDMSSPQAFAGLRIAKRGVFSPERTVAVADHVVTTATGRHSEQVPGSENMLAALRSNAREFGIRHLGTDSPQQGIVHVIAPELGLVRPGMTVVCGDSHTSTLGALGAWAWGIGTSEVEHVLATQTLALRRPHAMRITIDGVLAPHLSAKDLTLNVLRQIGVRGAAAGFVELTGSAVSALPMEGRLTLCNMGIEAGARAAVIAPDATTREYLRAHWPQEVIDEKIFNQMCELASDSQARYAEEKSVQLQLNAPQITWGTNPSQVVDINESLPDPAQCEDPAEREIMHKSYRYMGLTPGQKLLGMPVQWVFIGSCTNGRLSDLEAAARVIQGRKVAHGVRALVVPGSQSVKRLAEERGLDRIFTEAGFEWRESGCSMCVGMNADKVPPGDRSVSTTNRNFEGRQGPGARTHLASPATAAASAIAGAIANPLDLLN